MTARLLALVFVFALGLPLTAIRAGEPFVPSWIKNDPASKTVEMEIIADWGLVARYAKGNVPAHAAARDRAGETRGQVVQAIRLHSEPEA